MTRHRHLTTAIAIALAVIITVSGTSLVGSLVLCVGSDGHVDLEVALGACCLDENTAGGGADRDPSTLLIDSCGNCADIELDSTPLTKEKQLLEPPHFVAMDVPGQATACTAPFDVSGLGTGSGPPHLEGLATVVLLT